MNQRIEPSSLRAVPPTSTPNNNPPSLARHVVIGTILIVLLFVIFLIHFVIVQRYNKKPNNNKLHTAFIVNGVSNQQAIRSNCDVETVYSMTDAHCAQVCASYNQFNNTDGNTYVSKHGVCLNSKIVEQRQANVFEDNDCDPKNGVLAYIIGDTQFGTLKHLCLSIDVGVQPDDGTSTAGNTLCQNGTIDIDYTRSFPQLSECKCVAEDFLALIPNTNTTRARGVCVNSKMKKFYQNFIV